MVVEAQTELFSPAVAVGALQLRGRKIVQFHFLDQEGARHDGKSAAPGNNERGLCSLPSDPLCHFNGPGVGWMDGWGGGVLPRPGVASVSAPGDVFASCQQTAA